MIINVATNTSNEMLNVVGNLLASGSLELLSADGALLCTLELIDPGAVAIDAELVFKLADGVATSSGEAAFARAVGADGSEIFSCDVGDENSNAVIKLNSTKIKRDADVKLSSFRLLMP